MLSEQKETENKYNEVSKYEVKGEGDTLAEASAE